MASLNVYESKFKSPLSKPLMLRDYLLDDQSSCSSNGFKSFPRRQCCTTVRFLLEADLIKTRESSRTMSRFLRTKSKSFQRASEAVINAVKLLPFAAVMSPAKRTLLPRSLSRKLMRRSFLKKKNDVEIGRLRSFRDFLLEERELSDFAASTITVAAESNCSKIESNGNSKGPNCCADSDFNQSLWKKNDKQIERLKSFRDFLLEDREPSDFAAELKGSKNESNRTSNGWSDSDLNYESSCGNDVVKVVVSNRVGVSVGEATLTAKKEWPNEEKEQFSPVSVLDVPFDDEEEVFPPFQSRVVRMEGPKQKLMKIQQFGTLAQLDPVDLEKQFTRSEFSDVSCKSPMKNKEEEENKTKEKVLELLDVMKVARTIPSTSFKIEAENVLLDFFRERIIEECGYNRASSDGNKLNCEVFNEAKDWIDGQHRELLLDWGVQKNRETYVVDMEKGGRWRKLDEERKEVAVELEVGVFDSLVSELFLDLMSSS